jgi:hypothetical protein
MRNILTMIVGAGLVLGSVATAQDVSCKVASGVKPLAGLHEASGIAASRQASGTLWSHNDSGEPVLFAVSSTGAVQGSIRVAGATVGDWESMAIGACPGGSCLYIGDIGDNDGKRASISVFRVPEPASGDKATAKADKMTLKYPDRAQDAEALIVMPGERMFVVTKGEAGPVTLYRVPGAFRGGASATLERVGTVVDAAGGKSRGVVNQAKITDATASPDGRWIVLRTNDAVMFYAAADFTAGQVKERYRFDAKPLGEQQGEGIAFGTNGTLWLAGEGGGKARPGTLAQLSCNFP